MKDTQRLVHLLQGALSALCFWIIFPYAANTNLNLIIESEKKGVNHGKAND
jgi:hypothetical protein